MYTKGSFLIYVGTKSTSNLKKVPFQTRTKAFTLIELLTVISIIALLMAILLPTLAKAKRLAESTVCQSRLKQLGIAWSMYVNDNEDLFPPSIMAFPYIEKYTSSSVAVAINNNNQMIANISPQFVPPPQPPTPQPTAKAANIKNIEIFFCPSATKLAGEGARNPFQAWQEKVGEVEYRGSYGFNGWLQSMEPENSEGYSDRLWMKSYVKKAQRIPVLVDNNGYQSLTPFHRDQPSLYEDQFPNSSGNQMRRASINRHGNGNINGLFCDWSVRKIGMKELWELDWHKKWNPNNDPPPAWPVWMRKYKEYYKK
ncbi:MAG: type II secretion system protein [Planctomycetota bacterium]|jgi:prepilin-type N-terminal cleavage/methylation domain-containing protein/prepilin-type processing-associated H-X9-DG protein